jgi:hypothetical protein
VPYPGDRERVVGVDADDASVGLRAGHRDRDGEVPSEVGGAEVVDEAGPPGDLGVEVRDRFVRDGEGPLRDLLATAVDGDLLETSALMLCGLVVHSVLLHARAPTDAQIAAAVDLTLRGLLRPGAR